MILSWLRSRRRRKLLAEPFPLRWSVFLENNVGHYRLLPEELQEQLRDLTRIIVSEKRWLGRGGVFISEEMQITIAAQAALLLLGDARNYFSQVREVVVFPTEFRTPVADDDWEDDGLSDFTAAGQAFEIGTVLFAWDEVTREGREPAGGFNVVIHEFAHQMDFSEGLSTGAPVLNDSGMEARWMYLMNVAYSDHRRAIQANQSGLFFTHHAADNECEFFADLTEAFFCRSRDLRGLHPELYQLLSAYFRVDPASWRW